ncbi:MAG: carbamoyltransferase C-terminal domain-containing protein [bacterium]|nr:carbamoyltransferase C-terminal domain-containing protein [bacterium]
MIILGINESHLGTVAVLKNGKVLYCESEERITRKKNDVGYPYQAIEAALKATGIKKEDVDFVAYSCQFRGPEEFKIKRMTTFKISDYIREMYEYWKPILVEHKAPPPFWEKLMEEERFKHPGREYYDFSFLKTTPKDKWGEVFDQERIKVVVKHLGITPEKVLLLNHHLCHAYYAYYASPIDRTKKTAVITVDGEGDGENATVYEAKNGRLKKIYGTGMCNLGRIYRYITLLLGMKPFEHEYKVMGMAPYAKDYISKPVYDLFKKTLVVDGLDFKWKEKPSDLYFYFRDKFEGQRFDGIAGGLQKWLEDILVEWVKNVLKFLKVDTMVYSGGVSMNVKANKVLAEIPKLKEFFVPPSGSDESTAIGAAYVVSVDKGEEPEELTNAYLGYQITSAEIEALIKKNKIEGKYKVVRKIKNKEVAKLLAKDKIIARCVGGMEFGARALGNRSILCNPVNFDNITLLNERIKFRDFWMPFTPSILDYRVKDYLVNPKNFSSPYMTVAYDTTPLGRKHLKAATHPGDFTARPQMLTKEANPGYYDLIQNFEKLTGVGAVLNTSFNLHGEPIVRDAKDAWHTFINSDLDGLLLNDTLIMKQ